MATTGLVVSIWLTSVGIVSATEPSGPRPVTLGSGKLSGFRWEVTLQRDAGARGGQRPCVGTGLVESHEPASLAFQRFLKVCGALTSSTPPNVVSLSVGKNEAELSVIGMAFASSVVTLRIDSGSLGEKELKLKLLNVKQAEVAHTRQIRFAAFAVKGSFCLGRMTAYGKAGQVLFEAPAEPCASQHDEIDAA